MSESKRQRSVNFSLFETECLVEEVIKRASIIENKRTDAVTWKQKELAWEHLTKAFNAVTGSSRTEKMLKVKYDGIKRGIKQKNIKAKCSQTKTGGGPKEVFVYTPWEEKLLCLISLSVEGLPSRNDCDLGNAMILQDVAIEYVDGDNVGEEVAAVVGTLSEPAVEVLAEYVDGDNVGEDVAVVVGTLSEPAVEVLAEGSSAPEQNLQAGTSVKVAHWDSWTPAMVRTPRNKKLKGAKEKIIPTDKYSLMVSARTEILELQRQVAQQELKKLQLDIENLQQENKRREEKHQLEMKIATDEHNVKIQLMQLQKEHLI